MYYPRTVCMMYATVTWFPCYSMLYWYSVHWWHCCTPSTPDDGLELAETHQWCVVCMEWHSQWDLSVDVQIEMHGYVNKIVTNADDGVQSLYTIMAALWYTKRSCDNHANSLITIATCAAERQASALIDLLQANKVTLSALFGIEVTY